jgi:hypothetical protein
MSSYKSASEEPATEEPATEEPGPSREFCQTFKPSAFPIRTYVEPEDYKCDGAFQGTMMIALMEQSEADREGRTLVRPSYQRWRFTDVDCREMIFVRKTEVHDHPARCALDFTSVAKYGGWSFLGTNGGLVEMSRCFPIFEGFEFVGECKPTQVLVYLSGPGGEKGGALPLMETPRGPNAPHGCLNTVSDNFYLPIACMSHLHHCFRFVFPEGSFNADKFAVNLVFGDSIPYKIGHIGGIDISEQRFDFKVGGKDVMISQRFWASITDAKAA